MSSSNVLHELELFDIFKLSPKSDKNEGKRRRKRSFLS